MAQNDLTCIFYTANAIPEQFARSVEDQLMKATGDLPIISVSRKPIMLGKNIVVDTPRSYVNIYRQALIGARAAKTKYIALCEDDVLYSPEHFKYRPTEGKFAYNFAYWSVFTWTKPLFTHKPGSRRNLGNLICERDLFIEAMEERFEKYPDDTKINEDIWSEPSKYERQLGVTVREHEEFYTDPPNIMFSHETALSFSGLGKRKKLGQFRAIELEYWGTAGSILELYK